MKVSKNWLKDYLNLDNYSDSELEKLINAHVCETEYYEKMVEGDSGCVWETIGGAEDFKGAGSLCHGWSAIPIYFYHKLGVATYL